MTLIRKALIASALAIISSFGASAQYYQLAQQLTDMITPALSGSANYKGFVEASCMVGLGNRSANFLEVTTTQGFKYSDLFYMGVGAGVDVMFSNVSDDWNQAQVNNRNFTSTGFMIPLYTDFRFNFGNSSSVSFFADLRLGAAFMVGRDYVKVGDGYITNNESFYLKPTLGIRVPVSNKSTRQAMNFGIGYQLLTSSYWYGYSNSITLNNIGVTVSYEW